jgi:hypothetical protein
MSVHASPRRNSVAVAAFNCWENVCGSAKKNSTAAHFDNGTHGTGIAFDDGAFFFNPLAELVGIQLGENRANACAADATIHETYV